ncbi:unnamed protein product [Prorocentrum cordatum]|uniref:Uncharacterized protein n=1 Tax=Prorocentrum cordatum TaxID=2364126 RepID=A0ABN9R9Y8_9DINO|nr:unnamed protein product [Polarella glacialis]
MAEVIRGRGARLARLLLVHAPIFRGVSGVALRGQSPEISVHVPQGEWAGRGGHGGDAQVLAEARADMAEARRRMDSAWASASAALQPLAAGEREHQSNVAFLSAGAAPVDARRIRDGTLVTEPLRKLPSVDVNVIVKEDIDQLRQDAEFTGALEEADHLRADFLRYLDDLRNDLV